MKNKIINFIAGNSETHIFEIRVVLAMTFLSTVLGIAATVINIILDLHLALVLLTSFFSISSFLSFYIVKKRNKTTYVVTSFIIMFLIFLTVAWFFNGGSQGSIPYLVILFSIAIFNITSRVARNFFLVAIPILIIVLYGVEFLYPYLVIPYENQFERFLDITLTLAFAIPTVSVLILYVIDNYKNERTKANKAVADLEDVLKVMESLNDNLLDVNHDLDHYQKVMSRDMKMAIHVQNQLSLQQVPSLDQWDCSFLFKPMSGISGDFYDLYFTGSKLNGAALFDVSGHGIASGMIALLGKITLQRIVNKNKTLPLDKILKLYNEELIRELKEVDNYVTGVLLQIINDHLHIVNAGHTDVIILNKNREVKLISDGNQNTGGLLGIDLIQTDYKLIKVPVEAGMKILLYSDALIESVDPHGEQFGIERLMKLCTTVPGKNTSQQCIQHITEELFKYTQKETLDDDLTILLLGNTE